MKNRLALVLAASVGLVACGKREDPTSLMPSASTAASAPEFSTESVTPSAVVSSKRVDAEYALDNKSANDAWKPRVFFYNDPEDSQRRCQTVSSVVGVATTCWQREPQ